ncbi:MAG: polyprenyl synthetase family protein [Gemmatimonas sp.]
MTVLQQAIADVARAVEAELERRLPAPPADMIGTPEARLVEAMRYAALGPGKRFRPFLVVAGARLFDVADFSAMPAAVAVEMIHAYSLVHDDLPAMDDSDLRRGRPSCHVKFDQATAILAGDALLTLAFGVLAEEAGGTEASVRLELMARLAQAAGVNGMAGGQMLDLTFARGSPDIGEIARMERLKTGELIAFSCEAGAILGRAPEAARHALRAYAHDLGLAYQIADDLLDAEGSADDTGKRVGRDAEQGKATFVAQLGVEQARKQASMLAEQAAQHLDLFGEKADLLRSVADFVVRRRG